MASYFFLFLLLLLWWWWFFFFFFFWPRPESWDSARPAKGNSLHAHRVLRGAFNARLRIHTSREKNTERSALRTDKKKNTTKNMMPYKSINNAAHTRNNRIKNHLASSVIKRKKEKKKTIQFSLSLSVKRINRFLQSKNGRSIRDPRAKKF